MSSGTWREFLHETGATKHVYYQWTMAAQDEPHTKSRQPSHRPTNAGADIGTDPPDIGFISRLKINDLFTVICNHTWTHYVIAHRGRQSQSLQVRPTRSQGFETPSPFRPSHASVVPTPPHPESCRTPPSQDPRDLYILPIHKILRT